MMRSVLSTVFVWLFAVACLSTFLFGMRKQWKYARIASAVIAILSFALALAAGAAKR
jgi:hypothetical protein